MTTLESAVMEALGEVTDPELPNIRVTDLGMVSDISISDEGSVHIRMLPTFVGCPALAMIEQRVANRVREVDGVTDVQVEFRTDVAWTSERITEAGANGLRAFGIAAPPCRLRERKVQEWNVECPYCHSTHTHVENLFGPTACRSLFYCDDCRQPFEVMKPV